MRTMKATSYKLTEHYDTYIGQQVASGRYKSAGEVITEALRQHEARHEERQRFLAAIDAGMQGETYPFDPKEFKAEMRQKYADRFLEK